MYLSFYRKSDNSRASSPIGLWKKQQQKTNKKQTKQTQTQKTTTTKKKQTKKQQENVSVCHLCVVLCLLHKLRPKTRENNERKQKKKKKKKKKKQKKKKNTESGDIWPWFLRIISLSGIEYGQTKVFVNVNSLPCRKTELKQSLVSGGPDVLSNMPTPESVYIRNPQEKG